MGQRISDTNAIGARQAAAEHVGLLQSLVNTIANTSGLIAVPGAAWIVGQPSLGSWNGECCPVVYH